MQNGGACAVIFDDRGRVLVVRESDDPRRYALPGGAVDPGEAPQDAAIREAREEAGVGIEIDHLVGLYRLDSGFWIHAFRARIVSGHAGSPPSAEIAEVGWYAPDAIPQPVTSALHYAVRDAVAGERGVVRDGLPRLG